MILVARQYIDVRAHIIDVARQYIVTCSPIKASPE